MGEYPESIGKCICRVKPLKLLSRHKILTSFYLWSNVVIKRLGSY
jgi:hypothetical protein